MNTKVEIIYVFEHLRCSEPFWSELFHLRIIVYCTMINEIVIVCTSDSWLVLCLKERGIEEKRRSGTSKWPFCISLCSAVVAVSSVCF